VASAQAAAFVDFWSWAEEAETAYHKILTEIGGSAATFVQALRSALGESDMMAYLVMMAVRLDALRRVLKPTGAIWGWVNAMTTNLPYGQNRAPRRARSAWRFMRRAHLESWREKGAGTGQHPIAHHSSH
jgi:hypothetical protein